MTIEEIEESLAREIRRHEALKRIVQILDDLDEDDREWVLEKMAE
ncbi:hypothetical protein [Schlesneria sp. T3-172]